LFLQYVSTNDAVRDASVEADKVAQEFELSSITRLDVYEALKDAEEHTKANNVKLNAEEQRLLERLLLDRTRNGLALEPEKREELLKLKTEIMQLEVSGVGSSRGPHRGGPPDDTSS
jgi:Zn-dependent oligopeptidase